MPCKIDGLRGDRIMLSSLLHLFVSLYYHSAAQQVIARIYSDAH